MLFGEIVTSSKSMRYPFNSIHPRLETPCRLCYTSSPQLIRGLNRSVVIMSFLPWNWYVCASNVSPTLMLRKKDNRKTVPKDIDTCPPTISLQLLMTNLVTLGGDRRWRCDNNAPWPHSSSMKASDSTKSFTHIHPWITTQDTVKYTKKMVLPLIAAFTSSLE